MGELSKFESSMIEGLMSLEALVLLIFLVSTTRQSPSKSWMACAFMNAVSVLTIQSLSVLTALLLENIWVIVVPLFTGAPDVPAPALQSMMADAIAQTMATLVRLASLIVFIYRLLSAFKISFFFYF